jgi:integrase
MKLTQKIVDALVLPPDKADVTFWDDDCPGLAVRCQRAAKRWIVRYRIKGDASGRQVQVTLGPTAGLGLKEARTAAVRYTQAARRGVDAASEERAASAERHQRLQALQTRRLGLIAERYITHAELALRPNTVREIRRYLRHHWRPLHEHVADDLDRRTIVAQLEQIGAENGNIASNRARAYLSMCLAWAVERGLLDRNPVIGIKPLAAETRRDRSLSDAEIAQLWRALGDGSAFAIILRLLLILAARREEVGALRWSELDLCKAVWTLPASRSKNHRPSLVPLPRQAVEILSSVKPRAGRDLVFGRGAGPFSGWGNAKERLDSKLTRLRAEQRLGRPLRDDEQPMAEDAPRPWTIHDLRRSAVTHMAEIGIQPYIVESIVNHVSGHKGGIAGTYNLAEYASEKRAALQRWADHIEALAAGREPSSNVVAIRQ